METGASRSVLGAVLVFGLVGSLLVVGKLGTGPASAPVVVEQPQKMHKAGPERGVADLRREEAENRAHIATVLERRYLDAGLDVYVSVRGKANETLELRYVLMSRPMVHQMTNSADFKALVSGSGFRRVIFTDGARESWTADY